MSLMNNPSHTTQIRIVAALIVLSYAIATQAQMTLNVADVTNYKLSETLAWNNK